MSYIFSWDTVAINSYIEESEFILLKWNSHEVQKFQNVVEENLERLSKILKLVFIKMNSKCIQ